MADVDTGTLAAQSNGVDSEAGYPSRETGIDPFIGKPGSNQLLAAPQHDDDSTKIWTPESDVVQDGCLPQSNDSLLGAPTKGQPAGSTTEGLNP